MIVFVILELYSNHRLINEFDILFIESFLRSIIQIFLTTTHIYHSKPSAVAQHTPHLSPSLYITSFHEEKRRRLKVGSQCMRVHRQ
jgi:hypothetical protein